MVGQMFSLKLLSDYRDELMAGDEGDNYLPEPGPLPQIKKPALREFFDINIFIQLAVSLTCRNISITLLQCRSDDGLDLSIQDKNWTEIFDNDTKSGKNAGTV